MIGWRTKNAMGPENSTPTGTQAVPEKPHPSAARQVLSSCWRIVDNVIMSSLPNYRDYRFPPEVISHAVWLYHRFTLSLCDI
jgi:hypothetical protein